MPAGLGPNQAQDALTAARFSVVVDDYEIASFSELSGIVTEVEPVDYLSTTDKEVIFKKLPGKRKPPNVVLKRGATAGLELWSWHQAVLAGDIAAARKSASLVMYSTDGNPVSRYYLENAWPCKLEIGAMKAGASELLLETVTIVCENIQRVAP